MSSTTIPDASGERRFKATGEVDPKVIKKRQELVPQIEAIFSANDPIHILNLRSRYVQLRNVLTKGLFTPHEREFYTMEDAIRHDFAHTSNGSEWIVMQLVLHCFRLRYIERLFDTIVAYRISRHDNPYMPLQLACLLCPSTMNPLAGIWIREDRRYAATFIVCSQHYRALANEESKKEGEAEGQPVKDNGSVKAQIIAKCEEMWKKSEAKKLKEKADANAKA